MFPSVENQFTEGNDFGKGRKKGSRNRSTIVREILEQIINGEDLSGNEEAMQVEKAITLAQIRKALGGDTMAYKAMADSAYGQPKQEIEQNISGEGIVLEIGRINANKD